MSSSKSHFGPVRAPKYDLNYGKDVRYTVRGNSKISFHRDEYGGCGLFWNIGATQIKGTSACTEVSESCDASKKRF